MTELNLYKMDIFDITESGFEKVLQQEYTDQEVKVFVDCIMSDNIDAMDIMRCLAAIGVNMNLSHSLEEKSETDEDGELDTYVTSEFQEFINDSVEALMYQRNSKDWVRFYRDQLLNQENYELLHILKLEQTWNI